MAKKMGKGSFGKSGGGADGFKNKVVDSPMAKAMVPKGGKIGGGKGKGY